VNELVAVLDHRAARTRVEKAFALPLEFSDGAQLEFKGSLGIALELREHCL
jgi:hypothetical protein